MKKVFATGMALALAAVVGCGGTKIVPVSGIVKLDGKPYKNAVVSFQPVGEKEAPNPGRGSSGLTDEAGRFSLIYDGEKPGALVGKHRVRIFTDADSPPPPEAGGIEGEGTGKQFLEPIPVEWHELSKKEFEVPPGGTDAANFDIQTKSAKKK
jgi:hypothetical protein